ncbi:MAG: APC family permease [Terriglobales bacterium]|jgi:amino acid transporter
MAETTCVLKKAIGAGQFFTLSFAAIVGVGWIVVLGDWLRNGGPLGAIAAFVAAGAVMMLVGLCYAEISTLIPAAGGEMAYAYEVFGLRTSFVTGWFLALVYVSATAFEAISAGWIAGILFPALRGPVLYTIHGTPVMSGSLALSLGGTVFLAFLNCRGMRSSARFQDIFTWTKIAISVLLATAGVLWGHVENLQPLLAAPAGHAGRWSGFLAVFVTAPFWLAGFSAASQVMEEKRPATSYQSMARALLISIGAASVFYALLILSCSMAMPWQNIVTLEFPAVGAFTAALHSSFGAKVVLLSGLLGLLATWNSIFVAASRVLYALGRARVIYARFSHVNARFGSPSFSVIFVGVASGIGVMMGRSALMPIVNMDSSCFMLMYVIVCVAVIRLRWKQPHRPRVYSIPGGTATAAIAAVASVFMLIESFYLPYASSSDSVPMEWIIFLLWGALGGVFWLVNNRVRRDVNEAERRKLILGDSAAVEVSLAAALRNE